MTVFSLALLIALPALAAPRPYHLTLEAHPAAPFPFLSRFGKVTLDVYPDGVRAETFWLNGFSRNGSPAVTVENPFWRMYTEVPLASIASTLRKLSSAGVENAAPAAVQKPVGGAVKGVAAVRYRLQYGPEAWIDIWTTRAVPENPQLRAIVNELVAGISPATASVARTIPGTPIHVELNFRRYKKLTLLELKKIRYDSVGQDDALKVGTLYFKAPLLDAIWK
ncbi:MAG: hypothetical protein AABO58_06260 [Acidobacteriota bacterium]